MWEKIHFEVFHFDIKENKINCTNVSHWYFLNSSVKCLTKKKKTTFIRLKPVNLTIGCYGLVWSKQFAQDKPRALFLGVQHPAG